MLDALAASPWTWVAGVAVIVVAAMLAGTAARRDDTDPPPVEVGPKGGDWLWDEDRGTYVPGAPPDDEDGRRRPTPTRRPGDR